MPHPTRIICCMAALLGGPAMMAASTKATEAKPEPATVEELYAGEISDTGPQYLLMPAARRATRWTAWTKADISWTDNATFKDVNPNASNVTSLQGGLDARLLDRKLAGGQIYAAAGVRGQIFRYGFLGGGGKVIDYMQLDRNNFDLAGAGLRLGWQRAGWLATTSLQGALLRNRSAGRTFYRELAWNAGLHRQWKLPLASTLLVGGELTRSWTWTDTYGLLPAGWNDRQEYAVSGIWTLPLPHRLAWRLSSRLQYDKYTHESRERVDKSDILGAELVWYVRERLELRLFVAHEHRNSTEPGVNDYHRWEAGTGAGLRWEF